jgi:hypothetical protein
MTTQPSNPPQSTAPPLISGQPKSWLRRNWKWLVVAVFLCGIVFVVGIVTLIMGAMRGSDVVKEAVARARSNPLVVQRLGAPISEGWFVSGSINVSTGSGDADVSVPISGPKGKSTVYVTAQKIAGIWTYSLMQAAIEGSAERIDLLASVAQATPPPLAPATTAPTTTTPVAPAPTAAPSVAPVFPASSNSALATTEGDVPGLKIVINELKRTSNTVTLKFTVYNGTDNSFRTQGAFDGDEYHRYRHLGGVHLIDTQSKKKYFVVTDSDGKVLSSTDFPDIAARSQIMVWAKFPAPPDDVQKITVEIPHFVPLEDVPISR